MEKENKALFIIFGGSGDLAKRKLYPALFRLFLSGSLKDNFAVIGTSRRSWPDEFYENIVLESIQNVSGATETNCNEFIKHFFYQSNDVTDVDHYHVLKQRASEIAQRFNIDGPWIYYLAMAPDLFGTITKNLDLSKFLDSTHPNRLVIEKPFGHDLASAKKLNDEITLAFPEESTYRIDHYLGKEIVQNIVPLRFGNPILKEVWNNRFISNIQITLAEKVGVEQRAGYYENAGALRDMVQNHITQLLTLLTMEEPASLSTEDFVQSKYDVLKSIQNFSDEDLSLNFIRGQYSAGDGHLSYRDEDGVDSNSTVETFAAGKILVQNSILRDVPIYFRTGKRLKNKVTRIDVVFKEKLDGIYAKKDSNVFSILIDPTAGFSLKYNGKVIGDDRNISQFSLNKIFTEDEKHEMPEAYQRLFHDVLNGDKTNFVQWQELCASWNLIDQIADYWKSIPLSDDFFYEAGTMGPVSADELLARDHNFWVYKP